MTFVIPAIDGYDCLLFVYVIISKAIFDFEIKRFPYIYVAKEINTMLQKSFVYTHNGRHCF